MNSEAIFCHYVNKPMQYTVNFVAVKVDTLKMKNCNIFLSFAQNIDCVYTIKRGF